MNAAEIFDAALANLDDADLAIAVRQVPDADLAELVRGHDSLRRRVLMALLEQVATAGKTKPKPAPARKPKTIRQKAAPSSSIEERRQHLVDLVQKAGDKGLSPGLLALRLEVTITTLRRDIKQLEASGRVRVAGATINRRVYATAAA
jgi:HTH domain